MRLRRVRFVLVLAAALIKPSLLDAVQNALLQGHEQRTLHTLTPGFRPRVAAMVAAMSDRGWPVGVRSTTRDAARQRFFVAHGMSKAKRSTHQDGNAVDLKWTLPWVLCPLHV